jgi:UDP-GlcNAc:undecaprenyl-phosphate/decaprenyl-phosphate GlcNAc-1-phosphate transferase
MPIPVTNLIPLIGFIVLGAVAAIPLLRLNIRLADKLGLIDFPKARGVAEESIPIIGNALVLFSLICMAWVYGFNGERTWFLGTAAVMALMGYLDDRHGLSAVDKMLLQMVCVLALVHWDPLVRDSMVARYGSWGTFWAVFFILGLTNAVNFVDGIDGLAGVCLFVGGAGYLLLAPATNTDLASMRLASLMMGCLAPFLFFNVLRRKGFLGNVGSYFFSYVFGILHLSLPIAAELPIARVSLSGLCFLVPIADSLLVITTRLLSLRSPFQPDKGHLHHRLIQSALPLRHVLLNFAFIEVTALGVAVAMAHHLPSLHTPLPFLLCVSHAALVAVLIFLVEKSSRRRLQYFFQRMDSGEPIYFMKYVVKPNNGKAITPGQLRRLEALISAEIRVTDLCFADGADTLVISIKSQPGAVEGINNRVGHLFQRQRLQATLVVEKGEFIKVSRSHTPANKRAAS